MPIVINGNGIDIGGNPISNASKVEVQEKQFSLYSGFKNYIINGKKVVNQRALTSTNNSYNQDRWYKAGDNWYQGIEGDNNLISGKTYTLNWEEDATASYYVGTATSATINAQTFTAIDKGGSFTLTISAGQNLWIKFASNAAGSTFNFVQLEEGSVATPFENRPYGLELSLCQRYYEIVHCFVANAQDLNCIPFGYKHKKRITPTTYCTTPSGRVGAMQGDQIVLSASVFTDEYAGKVTATRVYTTPSISLSAYVYANAEL